jgi:hypothetical protein
MKVPITLPPSEDGAKLRPMIGAVIDVRVSTKEQTENLASPMPASWNQIASWLRRIDNLRQAA